MKINDERRMYELYLEKDSGKKHLFKDPKGVWRRHCDTEFSYRVEYKLL